MCPAETSCTNTVGSFYCSCQPGTKYNHNHDRCDDIDECASRPCHHNCRNNFGGFECTCRDGFKVELKTWKNSGLIWFSLSYTQMNARALIWTSVRETTAGVVNCARTRMERIRHRLSKISGQFLAWTICLVFDWCKCRFGFVLQSDGHTCESACARPSFFLKNQETSRVSCVAKCPVNYFVSTTDYRCYKCPVNSIRHGDVGSVSGNWT